MPTAAADTLARRGFSRSGSSTDRKYASVALTCEKPRRRFGLSRFATAFMKNPGLPICLEENGVQPACLAQVQAAFHS